MKSQKIDIDNEFSNSANNSIEMKLDNFMNNLENRLSFLIDKKLEDMKQKLENDITVLVNKKLENVKEVLSLDLDKKIENVKDELFITLEKKLENVNRKIDSLAKRVDTLDKGIVNIQNSQKSSESDNFSLENFLKKADLSNLGNISLSSSCHKQTNKAKNSQYNKWEKPIKANYKGDFLLNYGDISRKKDKKLGKIIRNQNNRPIGPSLRINTKNIDNEYNLFFQKNKNTFKRRISAPHFKK